MLQAIDIKSVCCIAKRHVLLIAARLASRIAQTLSTPKNPKLKTGLAAIFNIYQLPLLFINVTQRRQPLAYDDSGQNWHHHLLAAFSQYAGSLKMPNDDNAYVGSSNFSIRTMPTKNGVKLGQKINHNSNRLQT